MYKITRQDIEREGTIRHRVVVYRIEDAPFRPLIVAIVEGLNPVHVYKEARKRGLIKGRCKVEYLEPSVEDYNYEHN